MELAPLIHPYTYEEYKELIFRLAANYNTTGIRTEEHVIATKINVQRLKRIEKQTVVSPGIQQELEKLKTKWKWLLLIESWCGDGAQNLPIINKIAEQSPLINLVILLRDENLQIMDSYLTNGTRSIPKLICLNAETGDEIGTWGPRPNIVVELIKAYKLQNPNDDHKNVIGFLHHWYSIDKGKSLQDEFLTLIKKWNGETNG